MISLSDNRRDAIFNAGLLILVVGAVLAYWAFEHFASLPNYQRVALPVPILISYVMLRVDQYRNWASVSAIDRGYAIGALIAPPLLLVGSLIWLVTAPDVRG